ncbi:hypothetical protein V2J09_012467 [Rumex salicifolius]
MDPYEATKFVFSRIQHLDPENASKIMGLLLIQDNGEKEMIRLAFGPENLLHNVILKARQELGIISSNTPSTPPSTAAAATTTTTTGNQNNNKNNNPFSLSRQNSVFKPNGLKIPSSLSISSLASPSSASSPSWGPSVFPDFHSPDELISPNSSSATNCMQPSSDLIDEIQLQEQLSFLNDPDNYPNYNSGPNWGPHRRSCSVSDISLGLGDDVTGSLGWKPCLYYARGYCKNGSSCRFLHGGDSDSGSSLVGSPNKIDIMDQAHELLRSKSMQHQKLMAASQLLAASNSYPFSGSKCLNFLVQQQNESQRAAAALMMGEDMHKFSRSRLSRSDFLINGDSSPGSRQIYLTFPADSNFKEEDVSNYFSIYGPVQDVRIPYQQKRMFGFVTFVYPETVKIILAKGNPHFVCDARVLVKPYKEKGKVPDKFRKQQLQQMERGDFSACTSPTGLDHPRDPFDNQLGSRMMYNNTQDLLWRRKLEEQSDFQQALELQSRRLMDLQLDIKRSHHHRALSTGAAPFPSAYSPTYNRPLNVSDRLSPDRNQENGSSPNAATLASDIQLFQKAVNEIDDEEKIGSVNESNNGKDSPLSNEEDSSLPESLEHNLPDSPFASPTKGNRERLTAFTNGEHTSPVPSANGSLLASSLSPFKSCYFQIPRLIAKEYLKAKYFLHPSKHLLVDKITTTNTTHHHPNIF